MDLIFKDDDGGGDSDEGGYWECSSRPSVTPLLQLFMSSSVGQCSYIQNELGV